MPEGIQVSNECLKFIESCLTYSPNLRPSWIELKSLDFLKNMAYNDRRYDTNEVKQAVIEVHEIEKEF